MSASHRNIIWLASYPKSGNTWLRVFLSNYLSKNLSPVDINNIPINHTSSERFWFDHTLGINSTDLYQNEIEAMLYQAQQCIAQKQLNQPCFIKTHDSLIPISGDEKKLIDFAWSSTQSIVYLIRNPLDIAISLANHCNWPHDKAVKKMNDLFFSLEHVHNGTSWHYPHVISSWSQHVNNWCHIAHHHHIPLLCIKYEDMLTSPLQTFSKIIKFSELPRDKKKLIQAVKFSNLDELIKQESHSDFQEKPPTCSSFFGHKKEQVILTPKLEQALILNHTATMKKFGYL
jgi:aryl sulfotransferase